MQRQCAVCVDVKQLSRLICISEVAIVFNWLGHDCDLLVKAARDGTHFACMQIEAMQPIEKLSTGCTQMQKLIFESKKVSRYKTKNS